MAAHVLERVDVDLVLELGDRAPARSRVPILQQVGAAGQQRLLAHPDEVRGELVGDFGRARRPTQQVAARDVDLVGRASA